ncbi:MAG: lytic murein transglycosylase [Deltaproteobacteria bacterium]|uniref:lytic murein transglycosylase n=1 Tax=Desulfobacula sp. TaxID=2593537 RepID=UPI0019C970CD|nr:lytic murein transglycosylase [Candidatus Desulfobacula maris]MBL6994184.1 lytic murein transglycosylase [Desulfobacula sp.]
MEMQLSSSHIRLRIFLIFTIFLILSSPLSGHEALKGNEFDKLIQRLIHDGFEKETIEPLFSNKSVFFTPKGVSSFFIHTESSLNYDQFTSEKSIADALKYIDTYKDELNQAQKIYGVDKTIITAILLVETRLGTYLGPHIVINTLSTMAALTDEALREKIWEAIPDKKKPNKDAFIKKVESRSEWGYKELKALIKYTKQEGLAPETLKGSYAGAMGISQFMPSNVLTLAKDGNNDGKIDLFTHADAISSVANYLKHHGWKPGIARQKQHEVLFRYNHSNYYVDTLLKISDKLKG